MNKRGGDRGSDRGGYEKRGDSRGGDSRGGYDRRGDNRGGDSRGGSFERRDGRYTTDFDKPRYDKPRDNDRGYDRKPSYGDRKDDGYKRRDRDDSR